VERVAAVCICKGSFFCDSNNRGVNKLSISTLLPLLDDASNRLETCLRLF
jgi:hypothetical protein